MSAKELAQELQVLANRVENHWIERDKSNYSEKRIVEARQKVEDSKAKILSTFKRLTEAAEIAKTTLETVYKERDPQNIAAKCAAERLEKALA
jgi:hypothetical protein